MSENLHNIDKLFRDAIEEHKDLPSGEVWDAVDAALDKNNVAYISRKYSNLKKVAAALLLLLLSVVAYEILKPKNAEKQTAGVKENKEPPGEIPDGSKTKTSLQNIVTDKTVKKGKEGVTNTTNAAFDSLKNTKSAEPITASSKNETVAVNNNKNLPVNIPFFNNDEKTAKHSNTAGNRVHSKITGNKPLNSITHTRVKPGVQQADDKENFVTDNTAGAFTTELLPAENKQAVTLVNRINIIFAPAPDTIFNRQTPDVVIKKMRTPRPYHFSIMPFFSPQMAINNLKEYSHAQSPNSGPGGPPPPRPGHGNHKDQFENDEQHQTAYSIGVLAELPLGKNWGIQSGIVYFAKNISIEPKKLYALPDKDGNVKYVFDCSSGYSYLNAKIGASPLAGDSINSTSSKNILGYISVPLSVNYKFSLCKFSIIPTAGTVFNFIAKQKIATVLVKGATSENQTINKIEGLKKNFITAAAGVAFEYSINNKIAISIVPSGSFALTSINNNSTALKSYPGTFGAAAGIKIKF